MFVFFFPNETKARTLWSHQHWINFNSFSLEVLPDGGDLIIGQVGRVLVMQLQQTLQLILCLVTNMLKKIKESGYLTFNLFTKSHRHHCREALTCSGVRFFQFSHLCFQSGPIMSLITDSAKLGGTWRTGRREEGKPRIIHPGQHKSSDDHH